MIDDSKLDDLVKDIDDCTTRLEDLKLRWKDWAKALGNEQPTPEQEARHTAVLTRFYNIVEFYRW